MEFFKLSFIILSLSCVARTGSSKNEFMKIYFTHVFFFFKFIIIKASRSSIPLKLFIDSDNGTEIINCMNNYSNYTIMANSKENLFVKTQNGFINIFFMKIQ